MRREWVLIDLARATEDGSEIDTLTREAITLGDADTMTLFATHVPGADVEMLADALMDAPDARAVHMTMMARVRGADVPRLQEAVIASGEVKWMVDFAQTVKGAEVESLRRAVFATGSTKAIAEFDSKVTTEQGEYEAKRLEERRAGWREGIREERQVSRDALREAERRGGLFP